jgi:hypothetical protein
MKFRLAKTSTGLIPATEEDREKFNTISVGDVIQCKALNQRNVAFHRKFFALIAVAYENMPEHFDGRFPNPDTLREELIKRAGYYVMYTDFRGNKQYKAKSISFDSMGQKKFEEVYSDVLDVVIKWLIPDLDRELLEHEIMTFA